FGATGRGRAFFGGPLPRELENLGVEGGFGQRESRLARLLAGRGALLVVGQHHQAEAEAEEHHENHDRGDQRKALLFARSGHSIVTVCTGEKLLRPALSVTFSMKVWDTLVSS